MKNNPDKFKILNWNSFDVTCKNKRAIFTHCITLEKIDQNHTKTIGWKCDGFSLFS